MKFLNEIDGADKLKQDSNNRLVTDEEKQEWNNKAKITVSKTQPNSGWWFEEID